ncbi:MAG: UDP-N-acetylglucosamine 2-epimerase [Xanthobacteraceae bacterium]
MNGLQACGDGGLAVLYLMKLSHHILTDSGGLQVEAPTIGKPLLVLRRVTERPEAFESGLSKVIGTTREAIVKETSFILNNTGTADSACVDNPYGDGMAASRIVEAIERWSRGILPLLEPDREFNRRRENRTL